MALGNTHTCRLRRRGTPRLPRHVTFRDPRCGPHARCLRFVATVTRSLPTATQDSLSA